jgi:hypothetical protein
VTLLLFRQGGRANLAMLYDPGDLVAGFAISISASLKDWVETTSPLLAIDFASKMAVEAQFGTD